MGNQISKKRNDNSEKSDENSSGKKGATFTSKSPSISSSHYTADTRQYSGFVNVLYPGIDFHVMRQYSEHFMLKPAFQTNWFAPVEEILEQNQTKVLDVGCGAYPIWMVEMAKDFSKCKFYGFDIVEPLSEKLEPNLKLHFPSNCELKQADMLLVGLPYSSNMFDYVHQRFLLAMLPRRKEKWIYEELNRVTKDGGWVEIVEPELMPYKAGPKFKGLFIAANKMIERGSLITPECVSVKENMKNMGFVNISDDYISAPVGWHGQYGKIVYEDTLQLLRGLGPALYGDLDLKEEYEEYIKECAEQSDGHSERSIRESNRKYLKEFKEEIFEKHLNKAFDECVQRGTYLNFYWIVGQKQDSNRNDNDSDNDNDNDGGSSTKGRKSSVA